jgi:isoleucyl-tRNA synthetase
MRAQDKTVPAADKANPETKNDTKPDYRATLHLPKTEFAMRPSAARTEPELLEAWEQDCAYADLRADRTGAPAFTLHDGPPYANGHLHMGHALNKVLKDMVVRSKRMAGYDARLRPGWDCHGLPVEWKVEEEYRAAGRDKNDVPVLEFRQACRDYAARWVNVQKGEFKRLGVSANWDNPYLTMDFASEAAVAREFMTFLMNGSLYQGSKPVMWSPVEQTALAEAEVEYHDRKSPAVWVAYPVCENTKDVDRVGALSKGDPLLGQFTDVPDTGSNLVGAKLLAWTTTPWTLVSSKALAFGPTLTYGLYRVERQTDTAWAAVGDLLVLGCAQLADVSRALRVEMELVREVSAAELGALRVSHPLADLHSEWAAHLPVLPGDHVTDGAGTGLVHTAPSHGDDDYKLGKRFGLEMTHNLTGDGCMRADMPAFGGLAVVEQDGETGPANDAVVEALLSVGTLMGRGVVKHSYPHSWRSKAPVLFRATPQWFVSVDNPLEDGFEDHGASLRARALSAMDDVQWLPASASNRLSSMLETRPDWLLSRQRSWGVPLTLFTRRDLTPDHPDFLLRDAAVNARVLAAFEVEGADAWYRPGAAARFLAPEYDPDLYQQCFDVLDVWFESGASHAFALEEDDNGVADLYVEGTDQHRGWFQASLLHAVGTQGHAPYKAVLTHGFALDGKGRKMSKSEGNTVAPQDVVKQYGADVLRLWVAQSDYTKDFRAGDDSLKGAAASYRKVRNTLRFLLGVLGPRTQDVSPNGGDDRTESGETGASDLGGDLGNGPLLERWVLHRAAEVNAEVQAAYEAYDFGGAFQTLHQFCANDLSAVYLDARKDVLYCDAKRAPRRQASLQALSVCLDVCLSGLAPVLAFLSEEASRHRDDPLLSSNKGVHRRGFLDLSRYLDPAAAHDMAPFIELRDMANVVLETARTDGTLSNRMHAKLSLEGFDSEMVQQAMGEDLSDFLLVAEVSFEPGAVRQVVLAKSEGYECPRCRRVSAEGSTPANPECTRCEDAMTLVKAG